MAATKRMDLLERLTAKNETDAAFLARFFLDHGTEEQRERFGSGGMAPGEIYQAMADHVFENANDFERFNMIIEADVRYVIYTDPDLLRKKLDDAPVRFQSHRMLERPNGSTASVDMEQIAIMNALRYRLRQWPATVEPCLHVATVRNIPIIKRWGAIATIQFGPFELRRKYAL